LKQPQYQPVSMEKQVCSLYAVNNGYIDDVAVERVQEFEQKLYDYLDVQGKDILAAIRQSKELGEETEAKLKRLLEIFKNTFGK